MKKLLLFFSFLSIFNLAKSTSITVIGNISNNTIWVTDTVKVMGNMIVLDSVQLTINPGVRVEVYGNYKITVEGALSALGNNLDSVIFTVGGSATVWEGIYIEDPTPTLDTMRFTYVSFKKCRREGAFTITNAKKLIIDHCKFKDCLRINGDGGAIYMLNSDPIITNNMFDGNFGQGHGGAIMVESSTSSLLNSVPYIGNNIFINNECYGYGGAIYCYRGNIIYDIENNTFRNNTGSRGGAITCISVKPNIRGNVISDNLADSHEGGGIWLGAASCLIENNYIDSNRAYSSSFKCTGGAIYAQSCSPKIYYNHMRHNFSEYGGAIGCTTSTHPTIKHNVFIGNDGYVGSAIHSENGNFGSSSNTVDSNYFYKNDGSYSVMLLSTDNTFRGNTIDSSFGGGLHIQSYSTNGNSIAENNVIKNSSSTGIRAGNVILKENTISGNANSGIGTYNNTWCVIEKNLITDNGSSGINLYNSGSIKIVGNQLYRNNSGSGGAIKLNSSASSVIIKNNDIRNNSAFIGGGLFLSNNNIDLIGNLISNNSATNNGGGIYLANDVSVYKITNNTIVNNEAIGKGGGIFDYSQSSVNFYNTILYGNAAGTGSQMSSQYDNYDPNFYHCNIEGGTSAIDWNFGSFTGTNQSPFDTLPGFSLPSTGPGAAIDSNQLSEYWLLMNSPMIDNGKADTTGLSLPEFDLAGSYRVQNFVIDIGAYELTAPFAYQVDSNFIAACANDGLQINGMSSWPNASHQWFFNGSALSGETADSLFVDPVDSSDGGYYILRAILNGDTAWSDTIEVVLYNNPTVNINELDTSICSGDSVFLSTQSGFDKYSWNTSDSTSSIYVSTSGQYSVEVTDSNACSALSDTVQVVVHTAFNAPNLGDNDTICGIDSIQLSVNIPNATYLWNTSETSNSIFVSDSGFYYVDILDSNGCSLSSSVIRIEKYDLPVLTWNDTLEVCFNQSLLLNSAMPKGGTYLHSAIINDSIFNPQLTTPGTYSIDYVYSDSNNCTNSVSNSIEVFNIPTFSIGNDTSICDGDSVLLDAGAGYVVYAWSTSDSTQSIYASNSGYHWAFVENSDGCGNLDSMLLIVNSLPVVSWSDTAEFCNNETSSVLSNGSPAGGIYFGTSISNDSVIDPSVMSSGLHSYNYVYTDANFCTDSVNGYVLIHQPRTFTDLGPDKDLCFGQSTVLDPGSGFFSYSWSTGNNTQSINADSTSAYSVILIDSNDCVQSDSINISIFNPIISGKVNDANNNGLDSNLIYLLKFNAQDTSLIKLDSVQTDVNGNFLFDYSEVESYLLALPDTLKYPNYLPTYYMSSAVFQNAVKLVMDSCDTLITDIDLVQGINPGGGSSIGGIVIQGNGQKAALGEAVEGLKIVLINSNIEPVQIAETDEDGYFKIENLAADSYYVWVDRAFIENQYAPMVKLGVDESKDSLEFILHKNYLELETYVGIKEVEEVKIEMYPNPVNDILTISSDQRIQSIKFFNSKAQLSAEFKLSDDGRNQVDVNRLESGIYFIRLQFEHGAVIKKLLIQH